MKTLKKLLLVFAAVAILATAVLAGCAVKSAQAPAAPAAPAATETPAAPAATETPAAEKTPAADPLPENAKAAAKNHVVIVPSEKASSKTEVKPAPAPVPTPAPTPVPTPAPVKYPPVVTMNPGNVTVMEGGTFTVSARYSNAIWAVWHFVSPDGTRDLTYEEMSRLVPTMSVENGMYSDMTLRNVTLGLNGWKVYCRYSNNDGYTNTSMAYITVYQDTTPRRTGTSAFAFYEDGTVTYVYQRTDGTWELDSGIVYYLGTDGVYRSRGHADLYTQQPHPTPYRTGVTMTVFTYNGNATILYEMSDASWMTDEGGVYYEGMNGILHSSNGYPDLYVTAPDLGPTRTGYAIQVFYQNSNATTLYEMSDGSWMTDEGAVYYRGADGVFRSNVGGDLYTEPPVLGPTRTGVTMEVRTQDGFPVTLYAMSDASWMSDEGGIYSEGMNGVMHSMNGFADLYAGEIIVE